MLLKTVQIKEITKSINISQFLINVDVNNILWICSSTRFSNYLNLDHTMQATCKPHILHALHEVPISHTPRRRCNIPRGSHGGESTAFHHWGGSHFFLENMRTSRLDDVYSEIESTVETRDPLALKSVFLTFRFASNEKFF